MLLIVMQWICHCVRLQIDSVGVFVWALAPVFVFWFVFGCLLRCFRWRNASLAGGFAGRRFGVFFVLLVCRFAYSKDFFVLVQSFACLLTCKDRAISATSATLEEKKNDREDFDETWHVFWNATVSIISPTRASKAL